MQEQALTLFFQLIRLIQWSWWNKVGFWERIMLEHGHTTHAAVRKKRVFPWHRDLLGTAWYYFKPYLPLSLPFPSRPFPFRLFWDILLVLSDTENKSPMPIKETLSFLNLYCFLWSTSEDLYMVLKRSVWGLRNKKGLVFFYFFHHRGISL